MGIRDKKLISIISAMLKAEVAGIGFPEKGTPQGGIISPLLSNVVLNELDWWLASQWEEIPTQYQFNINLNPNGSLNKGNKYVALRRSNLKEIAFVRYTDDFKIFTTSYQNAVKLFHATKNWLKERLCLDISPEKSKVINLKEKYSEFLEFKLKVVKRGKCSRGKNKGKPKYVVESHVREESIKKIKAKLDKLIYTIEYPKGNTEYKAINNYNSFVIGVHEYYCMATNASLDFRKLAFSSHKSLKARLGKRIKSTQEVKKNKIQLYITNVMKERYGKSEQLKYVRGIALAPIGYIKHKYPMAKKRVINLYTKAGRAEIHKNLEKVDMKILHYLMRNPVAYKSIEYNDNRLSLYSAQMGKCAITGKAMEIGDIHCHHKVPICHGGTDKYQNLVLVCEKAHKLIHATNPETINKLLAELNLNSKQLKTLEKLRNLVLVESC